MRSVFIIFSTNHIGGAEKRFAGLWRSFQQTDQLALKVVLVLNQALYDRLVEAGELADANKNIIVTKLSEKNFKTYRLNVGQFIKQNTVKGDIIHFVGLSPVVLSHGRKQLFSLTGTNINIIGHVNKWLILASCFMASAIDVLDPKVHRQIVKYFFWKKEIYKTSNSFCDTELFTPGPFDQRKNWIVLLGRFEPIKQVEALVEALPLLSKHLKEILQQDFRFIILGHGPLEEKLRMIIRQPQFRGVPVVIEYEKKPDKVLRESKVILSLQRHNNYPSRSLLEAMAAGNVPLVTDNGDTRLIAKPEFSFYVPETFTPEDLAEQLVKIFNMDKKTWLYKSQSARNVVIQDHSIEKMAAYFNNIYQNM